MCLAWRLLDSMAPHERMLVVDRSLPSTRDHALGFWAVAKTPFEALVSQHWPNVEVASGESVLSLQARRWRYAVMQRAQFHSAVLGRLRQDPRVTLFESSVDDVREADGSAHISLHTGATHSARWVYDSRPMPPGPGQGTVVMHETIHGCVVQTPLPVFDPNTLRLMDLRCSQDQALTFFYVLPFTSQRALVEVVAIHAPGRHPDLSHRVLSDYLRSFFGVERFTIEAEEAGSLVLTDHHVTRQRGHRVLRMGTAGGLLKASTGYAFSRILRDTEAVVASVAAHGHPFALPADRPLFRWLDAILLHAVLREPARVAQAVQAMFHRNPLDRVLGFLEEETPLRETLALIRTMPPWPFVGALASWTGSALSSWVRRLAAQAKTAVRRVRPPP